MYIPLLLSKVSLKRAGTVLYMKNDRAVMFNQPVELEFTSSGHYCVNIMDNESSPKDMKCSEQILATAEEERNEDENEILIISDKMSPAEKRNILMKLHKQFVHASADKLQ